MIVQRLRKCNIFPTEYHLIGDADTHYLGRMSLDSGERGGACSDLDRDSTVATVSGPTTRA